uniref:WAP domain-containing protein n=1 Tax=Sinocyclocheilus rhinocerous TaxID=307959 RepID=A0A673HUP0_9TELE
MLLSFSYCILKWHTVYMHELKLTICVHAVKPGQCPIPEMIPLCAKSCFHDGQCPATQKCCPTSAGFHLIFEQLSCVFWQQVAQG